MPKMFFDRLADVCHDLLYCDRPLYEYLKERSISASTIKKYKIGAFPQDLRRLFNRISAKELVKNGIIWNAVKSQFNTPCLYPIVIPIRDPYGKTVAIGCRTVLSDPERKKIEIRTGDATPKYKNSEYKKTQYLFGLDKAISAIRAKDSVFIVEGYFDVISAHQAGIKNVVATCGTLFSRHQLIVLSRYTNNICLLFDNDGPGRLNARKIKGRIGKDEVVKMNIRCRFTPEGFKDIDEYIKSGGNLSFFEGNND
jgi:DNA primase